VPVFFSEEFTKEAEKLIRENEKLIKKLKEKKEGNR